MGLGLAPPFSATINCRVKQYTCDFEYPLFSNLSSASTTHLFCVQRTGSLRIQTFSTRSLEKKGHVQIRGQVKVEDDTNEEACELVNGAELTIGDGSDSIRAHLFQAVKNNNGTAVLLLSDIFGFQDSSTRDFAYRTACNGYNVLVPDLFRGNPWRQDRPKSMFEQWLATQDADRVAKDIKTSTKWMVEEFLADENSKKLGIIGFCYGGGRVIEVLAQDHDSCFGTGVSFYGMKIDKAIAADVKVPVLFITGDKDPLCPVDSLSEVAQIVGNDSKVVVFEGRGHGFAHRPQSNEEDADAEAAFLNMRNWFHDRLV